MNFFRARQKAATIADRLFAIVCRGWTTQRRWGSTLFIFHRFTRLVTPTARDGTIRPRPSRAIRECVGDRQRGRRTQGGRAFARDARRFRLVSKRGAKTRNGNRPRFCAELLAQSSLCQRASRMVLQTAGWHDQVRGEPTQKVRRHLSSEFSL